MAGALTLELIRLFVLLVGSAAVVALLARRIALPYSVALVVFGLAVGALLPNPDLRLAPDLVLLVLLPGLVFEGAYRIDFRLLRPSLVAVAVLAGPGVLLVAIGVAVALQLAANVPLPVGFVVGAMLSATDPAAVIASFKRIRAPRRLSTLVEAESLFNDGTGIVLFTMAVAAIAAPIDPGTAVIAFAVTVVASAAIGAAAGVVVSQLIVRVSDHVVELAFSLVLAYGTYLIADAVHLSGIVAVAVAGLVLGNYGRSIGLAGRTLEALDTVWEFLAFLLTAIVFLIIGLTIEFTDLAGAILPIAVAAIGVVAVRALLVYPVLDLVEGFAVRRSAGEATPQAWRHVIFWSGLRGAVSVALALALPGDFPQRALVQQVVFGVVLFTLLVQATTAEPLLERLGLRDSRRDEEERASG